MKEAIIFCAGKLGSEAFGWLSESYKILFYVDNNSSLEGTVVNGIPVCKPDCILEYPNMDIVIAAAYPSEIVEQLERMMVPNKIFIYCNAFTPDIELIKVANYDYSYTWSEFAYQKSQVYNKDVDEFLELEGERLRIALDTIKKFAVHGTATKILEIGCGGGQFAKMLFRNGYTNYTGIDISENAVCLAKNINIPHKDKFFSGNALDFLNASEYDMVIMLEVLEHIKDDITLIKKIKPGKLCCLSVPDFQSFNHYRTYDDLEAIQERYGEFMEFQYYKENIFSNTVKYLFVVGKRK